MEETGNLRLQGYLDPLAEEFRPRTPPPTTFSHHPQIALVQHQIYYPYPCSSSSSSPPLQVMAPPPPPPLPMVPPPPAYFRQNGAGLPPLVSSAATRSLLLSLVPVDVTEDRVRRELGVFGEVRAVEMERLVHEGILTVHFFDLRHAEAALMEIQAQHMHLQHRLRQHYYNNMSNNNNPLLIPSWGFKPDHNFSSQLAPPCPGLIAGRAVWAQFITSATPAMVPAVSDWNNQGTLVVFNLDLSVSGSRLKEIFEAFGAVKELRETPLKRNQRFVEFFDIRDAAKALSEMNGKEINGQSILIEFSRPGGNRRRGFNTFNPSSSEINNSFYSRISNYQNPPPPLSVPLKLFKRSNSNSSSSNSSPQSQRSGKKSGFGGGFKNSTSSPRFHGGRRRIGDGVVAEIVSPMSSLSLGHSRNGSSEEGGSNNCNEVSSSRRNSRKNSNNNGGDKVEKQKRTHPWKNRLKISSDSRFLIDENAAMGSSSNRDPRTTIMIKNIPNKYSQKLLLNMLDNHCIHCNEQIISSKGDQEEEEDDRQPLSAYDFLYLPIDFNNKCNVGYGFVNMTSPQATWRLYKAFHLQPWEVFNSRKICEVTYARLQGLEALKEHFKNSKFACETDDYLPVVFSPPRDGKLLTEPVPMGTGHSSNTAVTTTTTLGTLSSKKVLLLGGGGGGSSSNSHLQLENEGGGASEEGYYYDAEEVELEEEGGDGDDGDVGRRSCRKKKTQEVVMVVPNDNKVVFGGGKKRNGGSNGCLVSSSEPQTQPNKSLLMSI